MNRWIVILALAALPASATAQRAAVVGAVRVSDRVEVGFTYSPEPRAAHYRGPEVYRWTGRRVAYRQPGYRWTTHAARAAYFHELTLEHDRLHYDMRFMAPGHAKRLHRWWHHEAGYGHGWFVEREIERSRRRGPVAQPRGPRHRWP